MATSRPFESGWLEKVIKRIWSRLQTLGLRWRSRRLPPLRVVVVDTANWAGIHWNKVFVGSFWAKRLYSVEYIAPNALIEQGKALISNMPPDLISDVNYDQLSHRGYSLWELSKTGILASLEQMKLSLPLDERQCRVVGYYFQNMRWLISGIEQYLTIHQVDTVIVSQGCSPMTRPFVEVARLRGINVVATENSFLGGFFICDNATGMIVNRHRAARLAGDFLSARLLSDGERRDFHERLSRARQRKLGEHHTGGYQIAQSLAKAYADKIGQRRVALFLGQVMVDASIILDGGDFKDPVDLISRCIEFFKKQPGWYLIVRLHPKESTGKSWVNTEDSFGTPPGEPQGPLPYDNLTYRKLIERLGSDHGTSYEIIPDAGTSTDELMDLADVGITITSQAGLEMALKHKRVVVCGDAFYARKGFTYDVGRDIQLEATLNEALRQLQMTESECHAADRYGKYLLDEFFFPRHMLGQWARFYGLIERGGGLGVRAEMLDRAVAQMEELSREGTIFSAK